MTANGSNCETVTSQPFGDAEVISGACGDPSPMHFTGQQRDPETASTSGGTDGLDDFKARYNSSSLGRFMSVDPFGGRLSAPQSLNRYSYVENNPAKLRDPTGLYTCSDDNNKCQTQQDVAFEEARKRDLKSQDKKIRKAAEAYGAPKVDNKVHVGFSDKPLDHGAQVSFGTDKNGKADGTINVTFSSGQMSDAQSGGKSSQTTLDALVAHEGTHVAQDEKLIQSGYDPKLDITHRQAEREAYSVEEWVIENEINKYNPDWSSQKAIDKYLDARPTLYPNLSQPILLKEAIPHD